MKNFQQKSIETDAKNRGLDAPPITDYMVKHLITFKPDTEISKVIDSLLKHKITGAPVLNEKGEVVGLIDDKDCLKVLVGGAYHNHPVAKDVVSNYMSDVMKSISIKADVLDAAEIFTSTVYKRLLVFDENGKLAGQISRRDILRAIKDMDITTW